MTQPHDKPILGDDGELIEADPNADVQDYTYFVEAAWETRTRPEPPPPRHPDRPRQKATSCSVFFIVSVLLCAAIGYLSTSDKIPLNPFAGSTLRSLTPTATPDPSSLSSGEAASYPLRDIRAIAWSPGGHELGILQSVTTLNIWDLEKDSPGQTPPFQVNAFAWSPDRSQIALGFDGQIEIRDPDSRAFIREFDLSDAFHTDDPDKLIWSPDGSKIAVLNSDQKTLDILDTQSGVLIEEYVAVDLISGLSWSPDGGELLVVSGGGVHQWPEGAVIIENHSDIYWVQAAWSPGGESIVLIGSQRILAGYQPVISLLSASDGKAEWTKPMFLIENVFPEQIEKAEISWSRGDSQFIAMIVGDRRVVMMGMQTGKVLRQLGGLDGEALTTVAWSPDGRFIAAASADNLLIWRL